MKLTAGAAKVLLFSVFPQIRLAKLSFDTAKKVYRGTKKVQKVHQNLEALNQLPATLKNNLISTTSGKMQKPTKLAIGSLLTLIGMVLFGFVVFPKVLHSQVKGMVNLGPGTDIRGMFLTVPFALSFKVYIFNVTNPTEIEYNGAKPILKEIGPFCYEEWKKKVNVVDSEENDTISYNPVDTQKPGALNLINKAFKSVYSNPTSIFLTATVDEILFDGVIIHCGASDFAGKAMCSQLKQEPSLRHINEDDLAFSLLGPKNGTEGKRIKAYRGTKKSRNVGKIVEYDGAEKMSSWPTDECNVIDGTDGTIFPPFLEPEDGIVSYAPDLCRSLGAYYVKSTKYSGIPVGEYTADLGDASTNEDEKCYCYTDDTCLKKGLMDLYKCSGVPIYASLPHFLGAHESYLRGVIGLKPNKTEHEIRILFESFTGSPLFARKRLQFNMPLEPIQKLDLFKNFTETVLPIFWIEETVVNVTKYLVILGAVGGLAYSGYLFHKSSGKINITPVHTVQPNENHSAISSTSVKIAVAGVGSLVFVVLVGFILFEPILRFGIKDQTCLKKRNEVRDIYLKLPFPLDFKIYFFNVSNPEQVQNGAIPIVKEVGPYCYDEYKNKIDVVDNDAEDSLTYSPYDVFNFNQNKSGGLDDSEYGMVNQVAKDSPALLSIVNQAIIAIFQPESIYITARVRDILFDGIEINCNVTDFAAKAVCTQIKAISAFKAHATKKNVFLFSVFGTRNATVGGRIKVSRGISNYKDVGRVLEIDGKKEINLWTTEWCNRFRGTDGWIIPPLLEDGEPVRVFGTDLCRNIEAIPVSTDYMKGLHVRVYEATMGDMEHNEDDKCYCSTPSTCMKKGLFDLSKIYGLHPVHEEHVLKLILEPMTSTPLIAKKRAQLNLMISAVPRITVMQNVSEALHPIFWMEEGIVLEGPLLTKVQTIFVAVNVLKVLNYIGLLASLGTIAYGSYGYFKNRKSIKVTPTHEATNGIDNDITRSTNVLIATMNGMDKKTHNNSVLSGHEFSRYNT
nr:unnamed protein product [Callosobruchus chinensis]